MRVPGMSDLVTCHLCAKVWKAGKGTGSDSYKNHYIAHHYATLENERRSL